MSKSLILSVVLGTALCATTITLQPSWNLIGTGDDKVDLNATFGANPDVNIIWAYKDTVGWVAYSPKSDIQNLITASSYDVIGQVNAYSGYWVRSISSSPMDIDLVFLSDENVSNLSTTYIDMNFSNSGTVFESIINEESNTTWGRSSFKELLVGDDDSIIAVGSAANEENYDVVAIYKYLADGSRDTSFGIGGVTFSDHICMDSQTCGTIFDKGSEFVIGGMFQSDGKIVVAQQIWIGTNVYNKDPNFGVARFNSDGTIDTSFGTDQTGFGFGVDGVYAKATAIQNDDKIVVVGSGMVGADWRVAVTRFTADGLPDVSFGSTNNGTILTDIPSANVAGIAIDDDDKILVVGDITKTCTDGNTYANGLLLRYDSNGSLDTTFDSDGIKTFDIYSIFDINPANATPYLCGGNTIQSVAIQADGKIVVMGVGHNSVVSFFLARFNENGTLDSTFGYEGAVAMYSYYDYTAYDHNSTEFTVNNNNMTAKNMKLLKDGSIMVVGKYYSYLTPNHFDFMALHFSSDGVFDKTYGENGIGIADVLAPNNSNYWGVFALTVAEQSDGKILLGGEDYLFQWQQPTEAVMTRVKGILK